MLKKFFGLLALIVALNFSVTNAAPIQAVTDNAGLLIAEKIDFSMTTDTKIQAVTDNAKLLSAQEIQSLNQKIQRVEQAHQIKIGVAFVKSIGKSDMITASNNLLDKNFANGVNGGIVLLVAMDKRKYEMSTDSRMLRRITGESGIPYLKKKFQSSLSAGDYYGAVNEFVDGVDELMTFYATNGGAYGSVAPTGFDPVAAGSAVVIALFIGMMIRSSLIGKMSNVHHAMEAIDYLKKNTIRLTDKRDTFLFMNVQRRRRSGGGGGGRGGGHGGGGHGGGGGSF